MMPAVPALSIDRVGPGGSGGGVPVLFVLGLPGTDGPVPVMIDTGTSANATVNSIGGTVRTLWPVRGLPARLPERLAAWVRAAAATEEPPCP